MAEYYFSAKTDMETTLCIAPITDKRIELSGEEIEDRSGYFLYQIKGARRSKRDRNSGSFDVGECRY